MLIRLELVLVSKSTSCQCVRRPLFRDCAGGSGYRRQKKNYINNSQRFKQSVKQFHVIRDYYWSGLEEYVIFSDWSERISMCEEV